MTSFLGCLHMLAILYTGTTGAGAFPACLGTVLVAQLFAGLSTRSADLCAGLAHMPMKMRMAQHEVMGGVADLGAVEQQADVVRIRMLAALFEAVMHGMQAGVMAFFTCVDACFRFGGLVFVGHDVVGLRVVGDDSEPCPQCSGNVPFSSGVCELT